VKISRLRSGWLFLHDTRYKPDNWLGALIQFTTTQQQSFHEEDKAPEEGEPNADEITSRVGQPRDRAADLGKDNDLLLRDQQHPATSKYEKDIPQSACEVIKVMPYW